MGNTDRSEGMKGEKNHFYGKKHTKETIEKNRQWHIGKKHTEETKEKIRQKFKGEKGRIPWNKGKHLSEEQKRKLSEIAKKTGQKPPSPLGKKLSEETRRKMSEANKGKKLPAETKRKLRESAFKYAKEVVGIICPRIGRNEKRILDKLENKLGYKIKRQHEVGGYYLDGYIPEINLAIEVDERPKILEKDIEREDYIKKTLVCRFLRIKDYD